MMKRYYVFVCDLYFVFVWYNKTECLPLSAFPVNACDVGV